MDFGHSRADKSSESSNLAGIQTCVRLNGCHSCLDDLIKYDLIKSTVIIQSFRTDRSGQTVQTKIRLLPEEQSDQGIHCLLFHLHLLTKYPKVWPLFLNFRKITAKFSGVRKFRNFAVSHLYIFSSITLGKKCR